MRVLIAGIGRAALGIAKQLSVLGHDVVVIDRDRALAERASEQHGLVALVGDATEAAVLEDAELRRADVVVAMLRRDADNLAVVLLARAAGVRRVMVRMRDQAYRDVYLAGGVASVLSETDIMVGALAIAIEHPAVQHAMLLGNGDSVAFELAIPEHSRVAGRRVSELAADSGFPKSCVFAALYDAHGAIEAPRGNSLVRAGSSVLLVARRSDLHHTIEYFVTARNGKPAV